MVQPQQSRTLSLTGAALPTWSGGPILTATRLCGTEKLGKLYIYTLDVMTVNNRMLGVDEAQKRVKPEALVGTSVTISIEFDGKGSYMPGMPGNAGAGNIGACPYSYRHSTRRQN